MSGTLHPRRASGVPTPSAETRIRASDVLALFDQPAESELTRALRQAYEHPSTTNASGLGRFLSVDPIMPVDAMRSPQLWNRYAYVGNNPINRTDPTGKILQFCGSDEDLRKVESIANSGLNGYKLTIDRNGVASLVKTKTIGTETSEQKALRQALQEVIGDSATTAINVASNTRAAVVGELSNSTIDPADMAKFGTTDQPVAASTLGHEVMEQYGKQVFGMSTWTVAHPWATSYENTFTGWERGAQLGQGPTIRGYVWGDVRYTQGDRKIDIRITMDPATNNVISVGRRPAP